MLFSYNWLKSFFKKRLPEPEKLAELLTMHSFEVEEVHPVKSRKTGISQEAKLFNRVKRMRDDFILDIDVLPNRAPDCFSHVGIAREIAAITDLTFSAYAEKVKLKEDKRIKVGNFVKVQVQSKKECPRYTARVLTDVKIKASPKWIQEKLRACGLRPINNVVDAANYVMLETGQPLHAFDFSKIEGGEIRNPKPKTIIVRRAKKGEKIISLDNERYNLDENVLIIADEQAPLAIAGIKGGKKAEIDNKTKDIVLESANFNSHLVRQASRKLNLKTDASWRFEHGLDPNLTEMAINQSACLVQEIAGGKIAQGLVDFYPKKVLPKKIKLNLDYVERLLGIKIPEREIKNILTRLEFKITRVRPVQVAGVGPLQLELQSIKAEVPTYRLDISLPEDLIEEIGRIYGYEKIPATFPVVSLTPPKRNFEIFWKDIIKDIFKELGFSEVYNYSFISEEQAKIFGYNKKELFEVENPISIEQKYLRPSLIPNLLKNLKENSKYLPASSQSRRLWQAGLDEIKIFELGKIFIKEQDYNPPAASSRAKGAGPSKNREQIKEKRMLSGIMVQKEGGEGFYRLKGVVDLLLNKLGLSNIWYDSYRPTPEQTKMTIWNLKKCAEIKIDGEELGFLGEISPKIFKSLKISSPVVVFDLDFEKLTKLSSEEHEYQPISRYPAAIRDLAILVPREIKVAEVLNKINAAGGKLVRDVDLFDIYQGEELPEGKKNLAFHIIYQAEDKTLESQEVDKIHKEIIKALEQDPEWQVRR